MADNILDQEITWLKEEIEELKTLLYLVIEQLPDKQCFISDKDFAYRIFDGPEIEYINVCKNRGTILKIKG